MTSKIRAKRLVILASGGPAPGVNSVISAAVIEALNLGWEVLGSVDGYRGLVDDELRALSLDEVRWIHYQGGAVLGMSRTNPKKPENLTRIVETLRRHQIDMLLTIGGDDTAYGASVIAGALEGALRTVHVPKTIDNDLPLPAGVPTFGFTTARHVGVGLVKNLLRDAETCKRWYFVVSMGRQAGHLALGIGKASGATLTLIPEEFEERTTIDMIATILEGAVLKRLAHGHSWGVAVLAEGLMENLDPAEWERFPHVRRDAFGHILLADIEIGKLFSREVSERLEKRGIGLRVNDVTLGYELRCASPVPFDIEYTRDLGFAAVRFLKEGQTDGMVLIDRGERRSVPFSEMRDAETGKTRVRNVDTKSESYLVARRYMERLNIKDFDDAEDVERLAQTAGCTPEEFVAYFAHVVRGEPAAYAWEDEIRDALFSGD
jgi:ATP-dependent phosphofructokinase / diphosphate-dependent phosphofructokinase